MRASRKDSSLENFESTLRTLVLLVIISSLFFYVAHTLLPGFWSELCAVVFLNLTFIFSSRKDKTPIVKIQLLVVHLVSSFLLLYVANSANIEIIKFSFFDSMLRVSFGSSFFYFLFRFLISKRSFEEALINVSNFLKQIIVITLFYGICVNFGTHFIWIFSVPLFLFIFYYINKNSEDGEWLVSVLFLLLPLIIGFISFWYQYWSRELIFGFSGRQVFEVFLFLVSWVFAFTLNALRKT